MMRRSIAGTVVAALLLVSVAACGGSEASPSPSVEAPLETEAPLESEAPAVTEAPSEVPSVAAETVRMSAACGGVAIRKGPSLADDVVVRVAKGTKVRVVETVTGEPYEAGSCGASGDDWLKIDRVAGKTVKKLYGVEFVYAAGGFFN